MSGHRPTLTQPEEGVPFPKGTGQGAGAPAAVCGARYFRALTQACPDGLDPDHAHAGLHS